MKRHLLIIAALSINYLSSAQATTSVITLQQLTDSIPKIMKSEQIPGLMVGITTHDSVILSRGFGYSDIESKRLVNSKTLFRMGSITKMFVSLGILKLVQEGKLSLESEISNIAPEIPFKNRWEATNPLKIVHLLEHTSGFDDNKLNHLYTIDTAHKSGFEMMMFQASSMVCRWKPGERYAYSNPNYAILGYLIEKISKKPYEKYLTETILAPLGMTSSNFNRYSKLPSQDVKEYVFKGNKIVKIPSVNLPSGPQGSLWSCSDDMIKFLQVFLNNGYPLFPENIITEMETVHSSLAAKAGLKTGYALGNGNAHFQAKYLLSGHNGFIGACYSSCFYNRALGIGFTISSNGNKDNTKIEELIVSFLEQDLPFNPVVAQALDKNSIKPFLGFYQFESPRNEIGAIMDWFLWANSICVKNDTLNLIRLIKGKPIKLIQSSPLIFMRKGDNAPSVVFTKSIDGKYVQSWGGIYYEKKSYFWGVFSRAIIVFMAALILISGFFAIVSFAGTCKGKGK
jgi:CubicO group peptidase (beta-lactamase class C family)